MPPTPIWKGGTHLGQTVRAPVTTPSFIGIRHSAATGRVGTGCVAASGVVCAAPCRIDDVGARADAMAVASPA
eukprot:CAMPEP_0181227654 /NCGR_PEP_ID=MMETSP1096-20121128/32906_1 /TAXON_ID=156174 ORGANISM="Chrysochromulina ericina, Strain CCMP281" /NCGR_SAMPLE_ID=MMETSP1096 /ASSEMBLY_ACC=CAM_ASM_000453 /LENGTH=72 /DNA_ID=CAMNT_0023321079 /DNA_START=316 /DNA_END=537 /DNA_ORIENTATION=-